MADAAATASPVVADAIIRFIWFNHRTPEGADWTLLATLPVSAETWWIAHRIMGSAADLLANGLLPTREIAGDVLRKLDVLSAIDDHQVQHAISEFAKHFPGETFLVMWRRQQRRKDEDSDFDVVPFDFHNIRFANVLEDRKAAQVIYDLEDRLIEGGQFDYGEMEILQIAIMQTAESAEKNLQRILSKAGTAEHLERVTEFVALWHSWPVALVSRFYARLASAC